ncbi:MAG TPA: lytic transglycosylase domain-containing protein [Mesorhizobium sp.]|jgi:hypothetical protein|nr:lytic transglycosylase domain-containing protein [Mesorhizobium sp.]
MQFSYVPCAVLGPTGVRALFLSFSATASIATHPVAAQDTPPLPSAMPSSCVAQVPEAARRFGLPAHWIMSVMGVESDGDAQAVSHAGAMGCMQVMPDTFAELRARYGFGTDPFEVRDNVLAGSAYLREMHDRYGNVGMLGAYNAGPKRWEDHLAGVRPLPTETVDYIARLGPMLGFGDTPNAPTASSTAPPPLSPASIFITWSGGLRTVEPPTERFDVGSAIVDAGAPKPSISELFVRRGTAADASPLAQPNGDHPSTDAIPSASDGRPVPRANSPSSGLFVPRSGPRGS